MELNIQLLLIVNIEKLIFFYKKKIVANGRLYTFGFDSHNQLGRDGIPHRPERVYENLTGFF